MGNYKQTHRHVDNTKLPRIYPQPNYEIKTRPPCKLGNTWRVNTFLKAREAELTDEAMPVARRKCMEPVMNYLRCTEEQQGFWMVFNCQEDFHYLSQCLEHEFYVEMDKRRRNMVRNPEQWWRAHYNQDGEIGMQAQYGDESWTLWQQIKYTFTGIQPEPTFLGKPIKKPKSQEHPTELQNY